MVIDGWHWRSLPQSHLRSSERRETLLDERQVIAHHVIIRWPAFAGILSKRFLIPLPRLLDVATPARSFSLHCREMPTHMRNHRRIEIACLEEMQSLGEVGRRR